MNQRKKHAFISGAIAVAVAIAAARWSGTRRAEEIAAFRRHSATAHLSASALNGALGADTFVLFAVVFAVVFAVAFGIIRMASRRRDPYRPVRPKRRQRNDTTAPGYAPFSGSGYWYGGPQ